MIPTEILLPEHQIQKRVAELAAEIRRDCPGDVHLVAVLKGAFMFLSDLVRHMPGAVSLDFIAVSSYSKATTTSGEVQPASVPRLRPSSKVTSRSGSRKISPSIRASA